MLLEHRGKLPKVHDSAWMAPTAVICGDVTISKDSRVLFGAVVTAEGGPRPQHPGSCRLGGNGPSRRPLSPHGASPVGECSKGPMPR